MLPETAADFVTCWNLLCYSVPDFVNAISVVKSFKYAITADHDEIEVVLHFERGDIWIAHNYVGISSILRSFGFNVSECFADGETTWKNTQRPLHVQVFLAWMRGSFGKRLRSVNLPTGSLDSDFLEFIIWLVVSAENADLSSGVDTHQGSRVTHVDDVDHVVDDHHYVCTRARSLRSYVLTRHHSLSTCLCLLNKG